MTHADRQPFAELLEGVYAVYRADISPRVIDIWWRAMQGYELAAVTDALTRHAMNPDTGQFLPKPADVVKQLGGTTKDAAIIAWAKVFSAIQLAGSWRTVIFDDPIIHATIDDLGGWTSLCTVTDDETPFIEKRFCDHYRAHKVRGDNPDHLPRLLGHTDIHNMPRGYEPSDPVLFGDPWKCRQVMQSGTLERSRLMTLLSSAALKALPRQDTDIPA